MNVRNDSYGDSFLDELFKGLINLTVRHAGFPTPGQVSNPCFLLWECGVLTTGPPGKPFMVTLDRTHERGAPFEKKTEFSKHPCTSDAS